MNLSVIQFEWTIARRRRRLFALNVGIPLLLVLPLALGNAPAAHAAVAYTALFVLVGTFGSAIPLLREADSGILRRIQLTGTPEAGFIVQRLVAGTLLDFVQLLPSFAVVLICGRAGAAAWAVGLPAMLLALLAANTVGVWVAATARSLAEGALFGAVVALFLLHGSGVFRTPDPDTAGALIESIFPFGALHEALLAASSGGALSGVGPAPPSTIATVLAVAYTAACASFLLERLSQSPQ